MNAQTVDGIALQVFNKPDLTGQLLETIAAARGTGGCRVYILQDALAGSRRAEDYAADHAATKALVQDWMARNEGRFAAIAYRENPRNLGTCATTRAVIDWAFESCETVVFSEDDTLFEPDAFEWFGAMLAHPAFLAPEVWGITGESKIFDSGGTPVTPEQIAEGRARVESDRLLTAFGRFNFMPSTCFGTNRAKWNEFGETRGHPNGDRDVNIRCKAEGRFSLWPVVSRVSDNGMHHPNGFSVMIHKNTAVIPNKTQHISSGSFASQGTDFRDIGHDFGRLFQKYTQGWRQAS